MREWFFPVALRLVLPLPFFRVPGLGFAHIHFLPRVKLSRRVSLLARFERSLSRHGHGRGRLETPPLAAARHPDADDLARRLAVAAAAAGGGANGRRRREQSSARCDANRAEIVGVGPGLTVPLLATSFGWRLTQETMVRNPFDDVASTSATHQQHTGEPFHLA